MKEIHEIVFRKKKYLQLPVSISSLDKDTKNVKKLSFHFCTNGKFNLDSNHWPDLEYIEIIGCRYFEFSLDFTISSKIKQIYFVNTEYVDIMDIKGDFPEFNSWKFENSKFIKFKGQFSGDNHLNTLYFSNVQRSELFNKSIDLPFLENLLFLDGCNFFKVNLSLLKAPKLERIWFEKSNYLNIISLGTVEGQLKSFKFEKCAYPKLNVDFSKLSRLVTNKDEGFNFQDIQNDKKIFRSVKKIDRPKEESNKLPIDSHEREFYESAPSQDETISSADYFLNSLNISHSMDENKFCSNCGTANPISATFCASCGNKFRDL